MLKRLCFPMLLVLLLSNVAAAAPRPVEVVPIPPAASNVKSVQVGVGMPVAAGDCDTINYACDITYFYSVPDGFGDIEEGMRFDNAAAHPIFLTGVRVLLYNAPSVAFDTVSDLAVNVYGNADPDSIPGNLLGRMVIPNSFLLSVGWPANGYVLVTVNLSSLNLAFAPGAKYHIGVEPAGSPGVLNVLLDEYNPPGPCASNRWVEEDAGGWHVVNLAFPGNPGNLHLYAIACDASPVVRLNEIRPWAGTSGVGDSLPSYVELFSVLSQNLTGWTLGGADAGNSISLPGWTLPAGAYLNVYFGSGADDSDFSDGVGSYYAGNIGWSLRPEADEIGLYSGAPEAATTADYVGWGIGGSSFGQAYGHAQTAGIWPASDYVELAGQSLLGHLARIPSGYDTDVSLNWQAVEPPYVVPLSPHNPIQLSPRDGTLNGSISTLSWRAVGGALNYLVEVDDDSLFGSPLISATTTQTSYGVNPSNGVYFWRVTPALPLGTHPAAVWGFAVYSPLPAQPGPGTSPVPQKYQHKDSRLLCIWNLAANTRPGCTEAAGANGPWDAEHPQAAHIPGCQHCSQYCTRASIQMVSSKFGGTLTQDEISYHMKENVIAGPEGDLGHNLGAWPQENTAYSWALNNAGIAENFIAPDAPIPWGTLTGEIDADRPVLTVIRPPGWFHSVVFSGYFEIFGRRFIYSTDPWPGRTGWYSHSRIPCVRYYLLPTTAPTGRTTDPNVAADTDIDGVMNFDEQTPRPFHSLAADVDSDDDQVTDKNEMRSYTFHDQTGYHPGHENNALNFPDIDGDGKRAENDCDSDNDGDFDGGEDINGDGKNPVRAGAGGERCDDETCQFDAVDKCLKVNVDKDVYFLGEPVHLVDLPGSRETRTYHANSTYNYEKGDGCPVRADGSSLAHTGSFSTDAGGRARKKFLDRCLSPGTHYLTVDVLDDFEYSAPDNNDPQTCWECLSDWFHGWHWSYDYPYHNPGSSWPGYQFPAVCTTYNPTTQTTTYSIECPWWWWCYQWPPPSDNYWLGVGVPGDLALSGQLTIDPPPSFILRPTGQQGSCGGQFVNQFAPDAQVQLDLIARFGDPNVFWFGYSIRNWQLPESLMTTHIDIHISGTSAPKVQPSQIGAFVQVRAGDSAYGWSPTHYDSISVGELCPAVKGDLNASGNFSGSDIVSLVNCVFNQTGDCDYCYADINCTGNLSGADIVLLIERTFQEVCGATWCGPCP